MFEAGSMSFVFLLFGLAVVTAAVTVWALVTFFTRGQQH